MNSDASDWTRVRDSIELPLFPISLTPKPGGGTEKKPLTPNGHKDAHWNPAKFGNLWERAQGFGVPMGQTGSSSGLYAFDIDSYKTGAEAATEWLKKWGCLTGTREHRTVSGGTHLIFALPNSHLDLPSRANIVQGLDSRGQGGWIAYGTGYEVVRDVFPHRLHPDTCEEIRRGYKGGGPGSQVEIGTYTPPEDDSVLAKRYHIATATMRLLAMRHAGVKTGGDLSRSAKDHSVAYCLAIKGWSANDIVYALMTLFPHGACTDPQMPMPIRLRAAQRSAARAVAYVTEHKEALNMDSTANDRDYLAMLREMTHAAS